MCGIWCAFSKIAKSTELLQDYELYFRQKIIRRGPNHHQIEKYSGGDCNVMFAASVLWLQGARLTKQPDISEKSIFLLNGDIFQFDFMLDDDRRCNGDTKIFHAILDKTINMKESMMTLKGPYAFIYLDKDKNKLYFGRDLYGRRSLLLGKKTSTNAFVLTSVTTKCSGYDFVELPALGIFTCDLNSFQFELYPWDCKHANFKDNVSMLKEFVNRDINIYDAEINVQSCTKYEDPLQSDLKIFDSVHKNDCDLYMQHMSKVTLWNYNTIQLRDVLKDAVKKRIENQPAKCMNCLDSEVEANCIHAYVGILFSGGLDCSVLALLAEEFIAAKHPIDLINVSFDEKTEFNSPDRITALSTLSELKLLRPDRQWNFVPVNVTQEELNEWRSKRISDLIFPLNSILDDSLGCALWFASRGWMDGYKVPCRVLVVGMGADELFGGYIKHRRAFKQGGWSALNESLNLDWQNISVRNLGRDDRVVSDHGRQLRTPYLDENLVKFLRNVPNWQKMYLYDDVPQGIGDKILLRTLAHHLGFRQVVGYKKRALQFGSRIANSKENANAVSPRL